MKAFIDTATIKEGEYIPTVDELMNGYIIPYVCYVDNIIRYVKKTGYNELYCVPIDYFLLADQMHDKKKFSYDIEQGIEEGYSFISFLGIRLIMIPEDKANKYRILK